MIYTIGYQTLKPDRLEAIVIGLDARLIDCRARPISRKPGYGFRQLEALLNDDNHERYVLGGDHLGGGGGVTARGIEHLKKYDSPEGPNCILMCMEHHPADCHRHRDITGPHFPYAEHILDDRVFTSEQLTAAIAGSVTFDSILSYALEV